MTYLFTSRQCDNCDQISGDSDEHKEITDDRGKSQQARRISLEQLSRSSILGSCERQRRGRHENVSLIKSFFLIRNSKFYKSQLLNWPQFDFIMILSNCILSLLILLIHFYTHLWLPQDSLWKMYYCLRSRQMWVIVSPFLCLFRVLVWFMELSAVGGFLLQLITHSLFVHFSFALRHN